MQLTNYIFLKQDNFPPKGIIFNFHFPDKFSRGYCLSLFLLFSVSSASLINLLVSRCLQKR